MLRTILSLLFATATLFLIRGCVQWSNASQVAALQHEAERRIEETPPESLGPAEEDAAEALRHALSWTRNSASSWDDLNAIVDKVDGGDVGVEGLLRDVAPFTRILEGARGARLLRMPEQNRRDHYSMRLRTWVVSVWVAQAWAETKSDPFAALDWLESALVVCRPVPGESPASASVRLQCLSSFGMGLDLCAQLPGHPVEEAWQRLDPLLRSMQHDPWVGPVIAARLPRELAEVEGLRVRPGLTGWWMQPFHQRDACERLRGQLLALETLRLAPGTRDLEIQGIRGRMAHSSVARDEFEEWVELGDTEYQFEVTVQVMRLALASRMYLRDHGQWPTTIEQLSDRIPTSELEGPRGEGLPGLAPEPERLNVTMPSLTNPFFISTER